MTKNNDAHDSFPTVGDYDQVEDVSGAHWDGALSTLRPRMITPPPPGQHVSPRTQRMVDAQSGEKLDEKLERSLTRAARHLSIRRETVDQSHPSARPMLEHLFGLNLPGRDRA
jgi:hypothetical protein